MDVLLDCCMSLFMSLLTVYYLNKVFKDPRFESPSALFFETVGYAVLLFLSFRFYRVLSGIPGFLLMLLPVFLFILLLFNDPIRKKLPHLLYWLFICISLYYLMPHLFAAAAGKSLQQDNGRGMQIIFLFLDNLLFLVFISAGIMFSDKEKRHTGTNAVLLSTNLFCIGIILFVIRTAAERQEALSTTAMISIVLSLILSGIFLVLFYLIREEDAEAREMAVIHNHLETQGKQNAETDSLFRSFQMLKHDMNHYVKSISSYVNNNDMAGVQHELNRLSKETETANALISGCSEVDAAVYLKTLEFKKEGIPFTCHLCDLSEIPITPFELNSIIINLLDNAKRAVSAPEVSDPYVDFRINRVEQMLIVQCSNTLSEKQLEHLNGPDPLKKAITENGLGLKVIRHIADRYDAVFTVNLVRDCFHAVVSFEYPDRTQTL